METGTCKKKNHGALVFSVPQRRVLESKTSKAEGLVSCGNTGEFNCPKEDTCCPLSATEWACCPSLRVGPNGQVYAICCEKSIVTVPNLTSDRPCAAQTRSTAVLLDSPVTCWLVAASRTCPPGTSGLTGPSDVDFKTGSAKALNSLFIFSPREKHPHPWSTKKTQQLLVLVNMKSEF